MEERHFNKITPEQIAMYCLQHSDKEPEVLSRLKRKSEATGQIKMLSGVFLGRLLSMISKIVQPRYILEIGGFTAYGTLCLAEGLATDGLIVSIEKNEELKGFADEFISELDLQSSIDIVFGDAREIIKTRTESFDLVFIDAAKRQYVEYYEEVLPKLRKGGVILADNTLWKGSIVEENKDKLAEGLDVFNKHVTADTRVDNILLPVDDGLHLIFKR